MLNRALGTLEAAGTQGCSCTSSAKEVSHRLQSCSHWRISIPGEEEEKDWKEQTRLPVIDNYQGPNRSLGTKGQNQNKERREGLRFKMKVEVNTTVSWQSLF